MSSTSSSTNLDDKADDMNNNALNEKGEGKAAENNSKHSKRLCKKKVKPWELIADQMPDFSDDISGKKEYMWKLNTLKKLSAGKVVFSVIWGMVMAMLDMSIVSVALVSMTEYFDKTSSEIQWVADGYSIFLAAFAIMAGKVGDKLGAVNVNHVSMLAFMIFSVTCTLATENAFWLLILSRLLQGISASFLLSTTMSLTTILVEPTEISRAMALVGAVTTVSVAIGPFIGGLLVEYTSWQFIFLINVPLGIFGMIMTSVLLPPTPKLREKNFDYVGGILTVLFLALIVFGITQIVENVLVGVICIVVSVALLIFFCFWEKRVKCPMMPGDVLFNYRVICGLLGGLCSFGLMALVTYQAPFLMQFGWGYTALLSGVCTLPYAVASGTSGIIAGNVCRKYSAISVRNVSNLISLAGIFINACSGFGGIAVLIIGTVVIAAGVGAYVTGSNTYIMTITPINSKGTMGGCVQCFRETGYSIGVALSCMIQDAVYSMVWGSDIPTGNYMPDDFAETYYWAFFYMNLTFLAFWAIGVTFTQISGSHAYEYERGFKGIPKKYIESFKKQVEECHSKGINTLGFPLKPQVIPPQSS